MSQKIRITTRASQFERRKQEHLQAGYLIEDEQPFPMNGFCSFTAVRIGADDELEESLCRHQFVLQANRPDPTREMSLHQTNQ
jgi:hypothetical protein